MRPGIHVRSAPGPLLSCSLGLLKCCSTGTHTNTWLNTHTHTNTWLNTHTHTHTHTLSHTHAHTQTHTHTHTHTLFLLYCAEITPDGPTREREQTVILRSEVPWFTVWVSGEIT